MLSDLLRADAREHLLLSFGHQSVVLPLQFLDAMSQRLHRSACHHRRLQEPLAGRLLHKLEDPGLVGDRPELEEDPRRLQSLNST